MEGAVRACGKRKRINDGGAAMVLVIVTIALVTLLVSVLLSVSLLNYQMKVTERRSKDNFYSAEAVLDQIRAGLIREVSGAAGSAYTSAMQNYQSDESLRVLKFRTDYVTLLRDVLKSPTAGDEVYCVGGAADGHSREANGLYAQGLCSYLDSELAGKMERGELTVTSSDPKLSSTPRGLSLKGLQVGYTDADGYYSEIKTDIAIGFPEIYLREKVALPNVFEYSLVAGESVKADGLSSAVFRQGIYAGPGGFQASGRSDISFLDAGYVVTAGTVQVDKTSAVESSGTSLWAQGIDVDGGALTLEGNTYLADDLTLGDRGAEVELKGGFYGYGGGDGAAAQSAIVLNCRDAELNLDGLDELMMSGNSFINGRNVNYTPGGGFASDRNQDILLGTSLSLKSDQIVYLAPPECLGTVDGAPAVSRNPMSEEEYVRWKETLPGTYGEAYLALDTNVKTKLLGRPLSDYGLGEGSYRTLFRTVNAENICYVYLDMTADQAAAYFRDYSEKAAGLLQGYAKKYNNRILLNTSYTNLQVRGNLVSYDPSRETMSIVQNTISEGMNAEEHALIESRRQEFGRTYQALCSKLLTDPVLLTSEELSRDVYENTIKTDELSRLSGSKTYEASGYKARVVNGDVYVEQSADRVKLVIASGDVRVKGSFSGLIICGGSIILEPYTGAEFTYDMENVSRLLNTIDEGSGKSLIATFFRDGDKYELAGGGVDPTATGGLDPAGGGADPASTGGLDPAADVAGGDTGTGNSTGFVDLESLVVFENWSRQ